MSQQLYCGACRTTMDASAFTTGECPVCGNGTLQEVTPVQLREIETGTMHSYGMVVDRLPDPGSSPISPRFSVPPTVYASDRAQSQPLDSGAALSTEKLQAEVEQLRHLIESRDRLMEKMATRVNVLRKRCEALEAQNRKLVQLAGNFEPGSEEEADEFLKRIEQGVHDTQAAFQDKARLDWLEVQEAPNIAQYGQHNWQIWNNGHRFRAVFLRICIDAAISAQAAGSNSGDAVSKGEK